jgi:nucleoside-diphosphate-sugar epimerase
MQENNNYFGPNRILLNMRIIVTGADGFVGGYLIPKLLEKKNELLLIGRDIGILKRSYGENVLYFSFIRMEQSELVEEIAKFSPDTVIHLASFSTSSDTYDDMENLFFANILFLGKLLDALKYVKLKLFIYTGSSTEYAKGDNNFDPTYLYSATKTAGRSILRYYSEIYNFKNISINPYNIYGEFDTRIKVLDLIYDSLYSSTPIKLTQGNQILDFIHVDDVVRLYISVYEGFETIPNNSILSAGTGTGHSLKEIASIFETLSSKKANIIWGGVDYRKKDTMFSVADISLTMKVCSWEPTISIKDGLRRFLEGKTDEIMKN